MIAAHPFYKAELHIISGKKFTNFSMEQYSKSLDITGLMAMPLKSSHVITLEVQSFNYGNETMYYSCSRNRLGLVYILVLTEKAEAE